MANVEYRHVGKSFGDVQVLRDLSLEIDDGEFVVLLGASGCGKTTLLRMTAGLETIGEGEILIDGRVVNAMHPRDRDIAMVFQNYALYPTMRVRENIGFSLEVAKKSRAEIDWRVQEAARVLNMTELLDRRPAELSGGQRQRVAMGRAMVRDAKLFLFDEPLSNLDAKLRSHMRIEVRQLHDRLAATTLYVTHDQIEAMTMADKIVLMRDGRIVQVGSADDLYDRPNCRYAAEFIGTPAINLRDGEIVADGNGAAFCAEGFRLPLPPDFCRRAGERACCGFRPNDLVLDPGGALRGRLRISERTGAETHLHLDVGGADLVAVVPRDVACRSGQELAFAIAPDHVHLFDLENGARLEPSGPTD